MAATISGSVLSAIFFDNSNCSADQEGFLLGRVVQHVTDTISDSQINTQKEETAIYVDSHLPCPTLFSFYDNRGCVSQKQMQHLLGDRYKDVIGWYRFRRNSSMVVSMRERVIQQELMQLMNDATRRHFLFCLCVSSTTINGSTHSYDHTFLKLNGRSFESVSVTVVNLGDTAVSDYKQKSSTVVSPHCGLYNDTLAKFERDFMAQSGEMNEVVNVHNMNFLLQQRLADLCGGVVGSEQCLAELETEVIQLRQRWKNYQDLKLDKDSLIEEAIASGSSHFPLHPVQAAPPPRPPKISTKNVAMEAINKKTSADTMILELDEPVRHRAPKSPKHDSKNIDKDTTSSNTSRSRLARKISNPFKMEDTDTLENQPENVVGSNKISDPFSVARSSTNPFLVDMCSEQAVSMETDAVEVTDNAGNEQKSKPDLLGSVELWEDTLPEPLITSKVQKDARKSTKAKGSGKADPPNDFVLSNKDNGRSSSKAAFSFVDDLMQTQQSPIKEQQQLQKQYKYSTLPRTRSGESPVSPEDFIASLSGQSISQSGDNIEAGSERLTRSKTVKTDQSHIETREVKGCEQKLRAKRKTAKPSDIPSDMLLDLDQQVKELSEDSSSPTF